MQTLILAGIAFPILFVIDLLWIGVIGNGFYKSQLGSLMRPDVVWPAALLFYVIYVLAIALFVLSPAFAHQSSLLQVAVMGALFGLAAYATYDLTNLATLKDWPLALTLVDLTWGSFVTALTSASVYLIATTFLGY